MLAVSKHQTLPLVILSVELPTISPPIIMFPILWGSIRWERVPYKCKFVDLRFEPGSAYVPKIAESGGRRRGSLGILCFAGRNGQMRIDEWMETLLTVTGMYLRHFIGMLLLQLSLAYITAP